jgi:hypothetical protein
MDYFEWTRGSVRLMLQGGPPEPLRPHRSDEARVEELAGLIRKHADRLAEMLLAGDE